jgi:REP element-mobilizing transposase RayT
VSAFPDLQLLSARSSAYSAPTSRDVFEQTLEQARRCYGFYVAGYVVMPEHIHLLVSEPERAKLSLAVQMLKQNVPRRLREPEGGSFWSCDTKTFACGARPNESRSCAT